MSHSVIKPNRCTCPNCEKITVRPASWQWDDYCSVSCYQSMPFPRLKISVGDIVKISQKVHNQQIAADLLGVSYSQFRRVVSKLNLRHCFPAWGGGAKFAV